ncbi:MAG: peptidase M61, partial [Pseudomonadota bacterium]
MKTIHYTVGSSQPGSHQFDVAIRIPARDQESVEVRLPVWIPGSYMVRDYARHVIEVRAIDDDGQSLIVERSGKSTWRIATGRGDTTALFVIYGWDLSVRGAHIDQSHAYFNGACVFPEVIDYEGAVSLEIQRPVGILADAIVATSMRAETVDAAGFGQYVASDYDELIDHPVEIAVQQHVRFDVEGIPHDFFVRGAPSFDTRRFAADCAKICSQHHTLLGKPAELDRYVFLAYALEQGYGGLEHRWSSSLAISRGALPQPDNRTNEKAYRHLLGLISHEYFHLWNVKRLKPAAFIPMDMSQEVHTRLLWVFEGITSYYDDLALVRAGVVSLAEYGELLAGNLTRILRTPGRLRQSLTDSSF